MIDKGLHLRRGLWLAIASMGLLPRAWLCKRRPLLREIGLLGIARLAHGARLAVDGLAIAGLGVGRLGWGCIGRPLLQLWPALLQACSTGGTLEKWTQLPALYQHPDVGWHHAPTGSS